VSIDFLAKKKAPKDIASMRAFEPVIGRVEHALPGEITQFMPQ